jgi:hypothetical protein
MTYCTIFDLVIGESNDPDFPVYLALKDNIIKATIAEYASVLRKMNIQNRRFARQEQIKRGKP